MAFTMDDVNSALTEAQQDLIKENVSTVIFEADMIRRLQWAEDKGFPDVLQHVYEEYVKKLRFKWEPKLIAEEVTPPEDDAEFAALVLAHDDYKDRATRDAE